MKFKIYETKNGLKCRIAIKRHFEDKEVMFKMYYPNVVEPCYYIPKATFKNPDDVVEHILENLVTDGLRIEIEPLDSKNNDKY